MHSATQLLLFLISFGSGWVSCTISGRRKVNRQISKDRPKATVYANGDEIIVETDSQRIVIPIVEKAPA